MSKLGISNILSLPYFSQNCMALYHILSLTFIKEQSSFDLFACALYSSEGLRFWRRYNRVQVLFVSRREYSQNKVNVNKNVENSRCFILNPFNCSRNLLILFSSHYFLIFMNWLSIFWFSFLLDRIVLRNLFWLFSTHVQIFG